VRRLWLPFYISIKSGEQGVPAMAAISHILYRVIEMERVVQDLQSP
jgi:hypothetical protein